MVCITSIAAHDSTQLQRMGLRRALITRRANLGDCSDAQSVIRRIVSPNYMRYPACVVPLPRRSRGQASTAELAVQVSQQALAQAGELDPKAVGAVIYCHATPDERTSDSTAGRLQFELGLQHANAFSVSQAHNTSLMIALDIAAGIIEGPESADAVLVVAADKLLFGRPPHPAQQMVWGDVAAAAVLTRDASSGWRIVNVVPSHFATPLHAHQHWPAADEQAFARYGAQVIQSCLADAELTPSQLAAVITTSPNAEFVRQVHDEAGLHDVNATTGVRKVKGLRATHASCADFLVRLSQLESTVAAGQPILAWCQGHNGEFACAVMIRIA